MAAGLAGLRWERRYRRAGRQAGRRWFYYSTAGGEGLTPTLTLPLRGRGFLGIGGGDFVGAGILGIGGGQRESPGRGVRRVALGDAGALRSGLEIGLPGISAGVGENPSGMPLLG